MTAIKATRFIRKPFVVVGYQVTEENMEFIRAWCKGHIIEAQKDDEKTFIRVPVDRPTHQKQTQAFVGTWVILSMNQRNEESFKVYAQDWLDKNFIVLPREIEEEQLANAPSLVAVEEPAGDVCCVHDQVGSNVRALPTQGGTKAAVNFRSPTR